MPWRRRPQAAFFILISATALTSPAAYVRAPAREPPPPSIDETLTRDAAGCAGVSTLVWHPLSGVDYTGRLRLTLPARLGGAIALYVGDSLPLDIEASSDVGDPLPLHHERIVSGPGVLIPPDFWLDDGSPAKAPPHISRLQLDASGERTRVVTLSLGRRAPRVLARLIGYPPAVRVPVCAESVRARETYFATGWFGEERDVAEGGIRWMRAHGAVLVSSLGGRAAHVRVRIAPAVASRGLEPTELALKVNDVWEAATIRLEPGFREYDWNVPDSAWVPGTNELLFSVSRTQRRGSRTLGLALASLDVR